MLKVLMDEDDEDCGENEHIQIQVKQRKHFISLFSATLYYLTHDNSD
jgi:hypothetical protein